jgi:hypothetical protein
MSHYWENIKKKKNLGASRKERDRYIGTNTEQS